MEINWIIIAIAVVLCIALVAFLAWRNKKDEKAYEHFLNHNEVPTAEDREEEELNND